MHEDGWWSVTVNDDSFLDPQQDIISGFLTPVRIDEAKVVIERDALDDVVGQEADRLLRCSDQCPGRIRWVTSVIQPDFHTVRIAVGESRSE